VSRPFSSGYAQRLAARQGTGWKRWAPNPYRWYLRHLELGRVLEVGCGVGRNLGYLEGTGVGIDPDPDAVAICRQRNLTAFTPDEFEAAPASFDALLLSHVVEHMAPDDALALVRRYLPFVRPGGRVVIITPQERGFASDPTHVTFTQHADTVRLCNAAELRVERQQSFPLPRAFGRVFVYNEFITIARVQ
jgi:SAM-dependent methyltransferase